MVTVLSAISLCLVSLLGQQATGSEDLASAADAELQRLRAAEEHDPELIRLSDDQRAAELQRLTAEASKPDPEVISGKLLKFTKGGRGKPSMTNVVVRLKAGAPAFQNSGPVGWTSGQLTVEWSASDDEKQQVVVTSVLDRAFEVQGVEYEGRTFSLETSPNDKVVAFAAKSMDERKRWFSALTTAMEGITKETDEMNKEYEVDVQFQTRLLGFRLENQVFETANGDMTEVLTVGMIDEEHRVNLATKGVVSGVVVVKCNDSDFDLIGYQDKLELIRNAELPLTLTFRGRKFMKAAAPSPASDSAATALEAMKASVEAQSLQEEERAMELEEALRQAQQAHGANGDGMPAPVNPVVGN